MYQGNNSQGNYENSIRWSPFNTSRIDVKLISSHLIIRNDNWYTKKHIF